MHFITIVPYFICYARRNRRSLIVWKRAPAGGYLFCKFSKYLTCLISVLLISYSVKQLSSISYLRGLDCSLVINKLWSTIIRVHSFTANTGFFFPSRPTPTHTRAHTRTCNSSRRCYESVVAFYLLTTILLPQLSIQYRARLPGHFTHFRTSINIHKMYNFLSRDRETGRPLP